MGIYKRKGSKMQNKKTARGRISSFKPEKKLQKKREAVNKIGKKQKKAGFHNLILVNAVEAYIRIACLKRKKLSDLYVEEKKSPSLTGCIFKAKVLKKYPGLKACFVDIGREKPAFLYLSSPSLKPAVKVSTVSDSIADLAKKEIVQRRKQNTVQLESLKEGQSLTVQVIKDAIKGKNVRVSLDISLPGRNLVYLPQSSFYIGISKRIKKNREQLKTQINQWNKTKGLILRTLAEGVSNKELEAEWEGLQKTWKEVQKKLKTLKQPGLVWAGPDASMKFLRDFLTEDFNEVLVDDKKVYQNLLGFLQQTAPKLKKKIVFYKNSNTSLFDLYDLEPAIDDLLKKKVRLKSGGFIVIEETEAAVVIDVNTGAFIGRKSQEDNILKTNLEAAKEIALQLRLRSCGGIILIDFIDMELEDNRQKLIDCFQEELSYDKAYTQVFPVSQLGVVQMTRKKQRPSLKEALCRPCSACKGQAFIRKT